MSNLSIFDPLMSDPFEPLFRRVFAPVAGEAGADVPRIRIDVEEKDKTYLVKADIPGVKKEDINIRIEGNRVQIEAETRQEKEVKEKGRVIRSERHFGTASRTFTLAHDINESKATAKYENGVLLLELPMQESTVSKRLTVQ